MPLKVHYLNVDRGDCTFIEFPSGHLGMIDICDVGTIDEDTRKELLEAFATRQQRAQVLLAESRIAAEDRVAKSVIAATTDPVSYYLNNFANRTIFRAIITHPHMDHMSGLDRLTDRSIPENFWHAGSDNFDLDDSDWSKGPYKEEDWIEYKRLRRLSDSPRALVNHRGDNGDYWTQDGIKIIAPTPTLVAKAVEHNDPNILSQVLTVTYKGWTFVFGGDADDAHSWPDIYQNYTFPTNVVLKASHHGRNSGYYMPCVREMAPWLTITSVGEPDHDATRKYRRYSKHTASLRFTGTITLRVDDQGVLHYPSALSDNWKPKLP